MRIYKVNTRALRSKTGFCGQVGCRAGSARATARRPLASQHFADAPTTSCTAGRSDCTGRVQARMSTVASTALPAHDGDATVVQHQLPVVGPPVDSGAGQATAATAP